VTALLCNRLSKNTLTAVLSLVLIHAVRGQDFPPAPRNLTVTAGKSLLVESAAPIERISVGLGDLAQATAISLHEVMLNGKTAGQTSLIVWTQGGGTQLYDVTIAPSSFAATNRLDAIMRELSLELPGQDVEVSYENETVFLRGRVKDLVSADRAMSIASTLGKTVNLLYVDVPPAEPQILLKVRFATVDRSATLQLGLNIVSTGAGNTIGAVSTQQFSSPGVSNGASGPTITLSDALNVFLFRRDLNLLAAIQALQQDSLLEILAEPNVLATNGKPASFLAGGEFPFPSFQPVAGGVGTVTVQFREYGVRLNFTPTITPRGTIRLLVSPEVSALDFTSGLVVQGFTIPALTVRKVTTEIELATGQSFAIGGLIDNQLTETTAKVPLLGDLPGIGKLFQSKSRLRNNTELIVIVTPELVSPAEANQPPLEVKYPSPLLWPKTMPADQNMRSPDPGPAPVTIPVETLVKSLLPTTSAPADPAPPRASPTPAARTQTN
jgi:pilus assembly protein CpaC